MTHAKTAETSAPVHPLLADVYETALEMASDGRFRPGLLTGNDRTPRDG